MVTRMLFLVDHCSANASNHLSYAGTKWVQASTWTSLFWAHAGRIQTCGAATTPATVAVAVRNCRLERVVIALPLHGAGEPRDVVFDEERVHERHRDRAQQRAGHQLPPEVDVAADQLGHHAHRDRLLLGR